MDEHEAIEQIKYIIYNKDYNGQSCDYGNQFTCDNALMLKDIETVLDQIN